MHIGLRALEPIRSNFNRSHMDGYTDWQSKSVATHELGHALGLADHYSTYLYDVMWGYTDSRKASVPYTHDQATYYSLWG